jgi:hypothetical protein
VFKAGSGLASYPFLPGFRFRPAAFWPRPSAPTRLGFRSKLVLEKLGFDPWQRYELPLCCEAVLKLTPPSRFRREASCPSSSGNSRPSRESAGQAIGGDGGES